MFSYKIAVAVVVVVVVLVAAAVFVVVVLLLQLLQLLLPLLQSLCLSMRDYLTDTQDGCVVVVVAVHKRLHPGEE